MDEQQLIIEPGLSVCSFFKNLYHRFVNGNAPFVPLTADPYQMPQQLPYSFSFDSHPGPIEDAITDAQNLHRSLFLFIFCRDNPVTNGVVSLLQSNAVAEEIRENFIFLPLDVTWPEGWRVATELEFKSMPLIAMIRPRGTSLWESKVYVKYEGKVGETTLLSSMRIEMNDRNPDHAIMREQDDEFNQAVRMAEEDRRRNEEAEEEAQRTSEGQERQRQEIEAQYDALMELGEQGDVATIRFQFPDSQTRTHKFPRNGSVRNLFVFARKFMFPRQFALMTGFPQRKLEESDKTLAEECREKQFIVYVEDEEE